ncbi:hypothetical protein LTR06_011356 [Exophiala xenobiotica]|nr:hypothetical protein LTR06_011356 [Exophiala xenobiotica]
MDLPKAIKVDLPKATDAINTKEAQASKIMDRVNIGDRPFTKERHTTTHILEARHRKNILAAMHWLISETNTCNFLHYSGHVSQVKDPDGDRDSGFDDTIVPVDFESNGQIDSDKLYRTLVSALPASSTLFVIFDCCHSGSAIELPYVYRSDADGNVTLMDNVKTGMGLLHEASSLIHGGFTMDKLAQAKELFAGVNTFFKQLQHSDEPQEEGVGEEHFVEDWNPSISL